MAANRRQDPSFVGKVQVNEREYNDETGRYNENIGNRYSVERYMPVPYELTMQVDVWTNNTSIKEQILEQILTLYNPSIEIQTSVNPLDWTLLSLIEMQDSINWSSRTIPIGTENPIDVMTFQFKLPIWINPPAKVKKQKMIEEVVANIVAGAKDDPEQWDWTEREFLTRKMFTPGNYSIELKWIGNSTYKISLRTREGSIIDVDLQPTITSSKINPVFTTGTSFKFNNTLMTISNTSIDAVVANCHNALAGTNYNVELFNHNQIRFINNTGGNNTFENIAGQPITDMGLSETTYVGGTLSWARFLSDFGDVTSYTTVGSNASQLRLRLDIDNPTKDIIGWIDFDLFDQNALLWKIDNDSLPSTTMPPIDAIINPQQSSPGNKLHPALFGQRYLLLADLTSSNHMWGNNITAHANDIIEFDGNEWIVALNSNTNQTTQYVINKFNGKMLQYKCGDWSEFFGTEYGPGEWRLAL
jgi:hypothetical protein